MPERRRRGRPAGTSDKGAQTRELLFETAVRLIAERGFEATKLRDIATEAGVSVGLLYRYFPSKQAIVLSLYDALSARYAEQALLELEQLAAPWSTRALRALELSIGVLAPQRDALRALAPLLVASPEEGLFAEATAFSRQRVQQVFVEAVTGAEHAPPPATAAALGRLLYLAHLAVVLWWLLDGSPEQRATRRLLELLAGAARNAPLLLVLPGAHAVVETLDALVTEGLATTGPPQS